MHWTSAFSAGLLKNLQLIRFTFPLYRTNYIASLLVWYVGGVGRGDRGVMSYECCLGLSSCIFNYNMFLEFA